MAPKWPMEAWAVSIVGTTAGPDVHLVEDRILHTDAEPRSLCGVNASLPTRTPFELNGCKRCCKAALKAGLTTVIDVNGHVLDVQTILDTNRPKPGSR